MSHDYISRLHFSLFVVMNRNKRIRKNKSETMSNTPIEIYDIYIDKTIRLLLIFSLSRGLYLKIYIHV